MAKQHASARVIGIANQSGGCGKTTFLSLLAVKLAQHGKKVLAVDMDGQADASHIFGYPDPLSIDPPTMYEVICHNADLKLSVLDAARPALLACEDEIPGLSIAVGSPAMRDADPTLTHMQGGGSQMLDIVLEPALDRFDYVLIDSPASLGATMTTILYAADVLIAAVKPGLKEIKHLTLLEDTVTTANQMLRRGRPPLSIGAIATSDLFAESQGRSYTDHYRLLCETYGELALPAVSHSVRIPEAYTAKIALPFYDPKCRQVDEFLAAYDRLKKLRVI